MSFSGVTIDDSHTNVFVHNELDRLAKKRGDRPWTEQTLSDDKTRFVLVWKNRSPLEHDRLRLATHEELKDQDLSSVILLGQIDEFTYFAHDVGEETDPPEPFMEWSFHGLRTLGTVLPPSAASLVAFAQAIVFWHRQHQFCSRCGMLTRRLESGHALECTNTKCQQRSFPRSDPAIIVATTLDQRILLGRQAAWPTGRYSTVAGFVEPGESLEMAVRREITEETGHIATSVNYMSSQPWPFPASLMVGFTATISPKPVTTPDDELEDIKWFTREQIVHRERHGPKLLPPSISISYRLIEQWFDSASEKTLAELLAQ